MRGRRAAGDALAVPDPHRSARAVGIRAGRCGLRSRSALVPRSRQPPGVLVGSRGHRIADTGAASLEVRARALSARPTARDVPRVCAQFVHRGAAAESPHGPSRRPPPDSATSSSRARSSTRPPSAAYAGAGTWRGPGSRAPSRASRAERETLRRAAVRARGPDGAGAATAALVRARGSSPPCQRPAAHPSERARRRRPGRPARAGQDRVALARSRRVAPIAMESQRTPRTEPGREPVLVSRPPVAAQMGL